MGRYSHDRCREDGSGSSQRVAEGLGSFRAARRDRPLSAAPTLTIRVCDQRVRTLPRLARPSQDSDVRETSLHTNDGIRARTLPENFECDHWATQERWERDYVWPT